MPRKPSERPQALEVAEFQRYLNQPVLLWYYKEINKVGSSKSDVDAFYSNFLREIFTLQDNFGIEHESRALETTNFSQKTDFAIRYFNNGGPKVILCATMKKEGESQAEVWNGALEQMVQYAKIIRVEKYQVDHQTIYLTVSVGSYLRFYELPKSASEAIFLAPAGGRLYELADDEEELWHLWLQFCETVKR